MGALQQVRCCSRLPGGCRHPLSESGWVCRGTSGLGVKGAQEISRLDPRKGPASGRDTNPLRRAARGVGSERDVHQGVPGAQARRAVLGLRSPAEWRGQGLSFELTSRRRDM